jgi:hypothetical protein
VQSSVAESSSRAVLGPCTQITAAACEIHSRGSYLQEVLTLLVDKTEYTPCLCCLTACQHCRAAPLALMLLWMLHNNCIQIHCDNFSLCCLTSVPGQLTSLNHAVDAEEQLVAQC